MKMLEEDVDFELISKYTGLSMGEILELDGDLRG